MIQTKKQKLQFSIIFYLYFEKKRKKEENVSCFPTVKLEKYRDEEMGIFANMFTLAEGWWSTAAI